jgi:hypothetical protein
MDSKRPRVFLFSTDTTMAPEEIVRAQTRLRLVSWNHKPQPVYGDWRKPLGSPTLSQQKRLSQMACRVSGGSYATLHNADYQGAQRVAV